MSSDLFFSTSSNDEDEVNNELAIFTEACQAAFEASKLKIQRTSIERDRYGAHDRLVAAYFSEHPRLADNRVVISPDFFREEQHRDNNPFLIGLDDTYMQLRSNILAREPLLDAKGACVFIYSEESHRAVVIGSGVRTYQRSQSSMFNSSVNNRGNTQRPQTFGSTSRPNNVSRSGNNENRRAAGGPTLVCEHYGFNGHTIDKCFNLIGYPADFGKKNSSSNNNQSTQSFNRRFMNSNNFIGSSSTSLSLMNIFQNLFL
ncbi:hypothetical protein Tco_0103394 [Tanacetum coccineum]